MTSKDHLSSNLTFNTAHQISGAASQAQPMFGNLRARIEWTAPFLDGIGEGVLRYTLIYDIYKVHYLHVDMCIYLTYIPTYIHTYIHVSGLTAYNPKLRKTRNGTKGKLGLCARICRSLFLDLIPKLQVESCE